MLLLGLITGVVLAACGSTAPAEAPAPAIEEAVQAEPEPVEAVEAVEEEAQAEPEPVDTVEEEVVVEVEEDAAPEVEAEPVAEADAEPNLIEAFPDAAEVAAASGEDSAVDTTKAEAVVEEVAVVEVPEIDLTDLSNVANTGRPQFLNSFATW